MKMYRCVRCISLKPFHKMIFFLKNISSYFIPSTILICISETRGAPSPRCFEAALSLVFPRVIPHPQMSYVKQISKGCCGGELRRQSEATQSPRTESRRLLWKYSIQRKKNKKCCAVHYDITLQGWYPGATAALYFYSSFPSIFYSEPEKNYVLIHACDDFHCKLSWKHLLPSNFCFQSSHTFIDEQIHVMWTNLPWVTIETRNVAVQTLVHV